MKDNDFGFSLVDENELKAYEEKLKEELEKSKTVVLKKEVEYTTKLDAIMAIVKPFFEKLAEKPEKTYMFWPNRAVKVKELLSEIDNILKK